jgi:hypothetical protein
MRMPALRHLSLKTIVRITPDTFLNIDVYREKEAVGGIRANVVTSSRMRHGPEVWIDAPALRELRDMLNEVLGDQA